MEIALFRQRQQNITASNELYGRLRHMRRIVKLGVDIQKSLCHADVNANNAKGA